MAPTITPRVSSAEPFRILSRSLSTALKRLSLRDTTSSGAPLVSVFALVLTSSSSVSRRALTSLTDLPKPQTQILTTRSPETHSLLLKRQNTILAIPTTYAGLNSGPAPGAVVGITLGAIAGFLLCLYILLMSLTFYGGGATTVVEEEVVVKRRSHSKAKSRRSSHHSAVIVDTPNPPPPARSRRETIVEIEEEFVRHESRRPSPHSPDQVIVEEEESVSEDIVEVFEDQTQTSVSSSAVSAAPPPRKQSSNPRRSGFRVVDPAEFGGGDAPMRRVQSRRPSNR